jgi:glycosyltransferase involved in cell wall biosynthesis
MKVDYLNCRLVRSGGTKIIARHVRLLREKGHEARILTTDQHGGDLWGEPVVRVKAFEQGLLGRSDIVVASWLRDVQSASKINGPLICHLCQGYEPFELHSRIHEKRIPPKYRYGGGWRHLLLLRKKMSFRRRVREIEKIYNLPTAKIVVSQHLREVIQSHYGQPCHVVPDGIDPDLFFPSSIQKDYRGTLRLLSVGPIDVASKGIDDTLEAVRMLKGRKTPIEFIRVSLAPPTEFELKSGLVDRFLTGLNENEMAELYRNVHLLLAPSVWEGVGLPAIEAMSCGLLCILTDSGNYRSFDPVTDFAYFVPPHSPEAIAEGVLRLKVDAELRERTVKRGFEVSGRYTLENMGRILEETLLKILKDPKGSVIRG